MKAVACVTSAEHTLDYSVTGGLMDPCSLHCSTEGGCDTANDCTLKVE